MPKRIIKRAVKKTVRAVKKNVKKAVKKVVKARQNAEFKKNYRRFPAFKQSYIRKLTKRHKGWK